MKDSSLCQHFQISTAFLVLPLALAHTKDTASSKIPIKNLQKNPRLFQTCADTAFIELRWDFNSCRTQEQPESEAALSISAGINSKLLMHHPKFPLPNRGNINHAVLPTFPSSCLARGTFQLLCCLQCLLSPRLCDTSSAQ